MDLVLHLLQLPAHHFGDVGGLKNATRLDLPLGHIGMVVSGRARELCWTPLIDWLKAR